MTSKSWSKPTRYLGLIILLGAMLWFLIAARGLISPLLIAALLAYIFNPAVSFVNKNTKLPRNWVVLLVYLLSLGGLITLGIIFVPLIPAQVTSLVDQIREIILELEANIVEPVYFLGFQLPLNELLAQIPLDALISVNFVRPDVVLNVVQATTTNLGWVLVVLVTTYYLLQDWGRLYNWFMEKAPPDYKEDVHRLYHEINEVWRRYFQGQLRLMFIIGVLTGLASAAVGLPGAVAFGVFAGVLDIILSVGPALVMVVAAFVAFYAGSMFLPLTNAWFTVLVLGLYGLIQMVENVWLRPRIMGDTLKIHPAVVFTAVIGSLALAGVLTALIIIPVIGTVSIILRYIYAKILDVPPWPDVEVVPAVVRENEKEGVSETAVSPLPQPQKIGD